MRSSWINRMWENSPKIDLYSELAPPDSLRMDKNETTAEWNIDWEAVDVQQRITRTIDFLRKGCGCKTGCRTNRCKLPDKMADYVEPVDECRECTNMHGTPLPLQDEDGEEMDQQEQYVGEEVEEERDEEEEEEEFVQIEGEEEESIETEFS